MDDSMKLPNGKTCADCVHVYRCTTIFGAKSTNTECDFYPIRYGGKEETDATKHTLDS